MENRPSRWPGMVRLMLLAVRPLDHLASSRTCRGRRLNTEQDKSAGTSDSDDIYDSCMLTWLGRDLGCPEGIARKAAVGRTENVSNRQSGQQVAHAGHIAPLHH